jgi:hypothetical protein
MANILVNGDFETGTLTPWVGFNATVTTTDPLGVYCAELVATTDPPNDVASISQTVTLVPGSSYTLKAWLHTIVKESFLSVFENANQITLISVVGGWQEYTFGFTASAATTTIKFEIFNSDFILDDGLRLDDISLTLNQICFRGDSLVKIKNDYGIEKTIAARDVRAGEHLVYSTTKNEFVELVHNVVTGPTKRFFLIKKDSLGPGQPSNDFYVTGSHRVIYKGFEIKARDFPGATRVKIPAENLYTFVVQDRQPVSINGLEVMAYSVDEWENYREYRRLDWIENS